MILTEMLNSHMLYCILNYTVHAWLPIQITAQAYENTALNKEMAVLAANRVFSRFWSLELCRINEQWSEK